MRGAPHHRHLALEGVDGAGKSTLGRLIATHVRAQGIPLSRIGQHSWLSPDATRVIVDLREGRACEYSVETIVDAYVRDKQLLSRSIGNLLETRNVLSDRYIVSDAVYMDALYGIPYRDTLDRHRAAGTRFPGLLIYLDVPASVASARVLKRGKSMRHYENTYTLAAVQRVYQRLLFEDPPPYLPPVVVFGNEDGAHDDGRAQPVLAAVDAYLADAPIPGTGLRDMTRV
ncbi:hypothetical protein GCM10010124_06080 [Pilimelia terevasa]|uniref:Thymidylate kinase-like domain-containing protein n=1 Tax=Pilimelia terevasa TaxID=53372 RepID=A0A8J3BEQ5_9ACTN|nr:hypothetical protein [Pilimelia terevasa]GGK16276.1 hypothetical protein GCM10010124_06080 [Pilimelia terevasa]